MNTISKLLKAIGTKKAKSLPGTVVIVTASELAAHAQMMNQDTRGW